MVVTVVVAVVSVTWLLTPVLTDVCPSYLQGKQTSTVLYDLFITQAIAKVQLFNAMSIYSLFRTHNGMIQCTYN